MSSPSSRQPDLPFAASNAREEDPAATRRAISWSLTEVKGEPRVEIRDGERVLTRLSTVAFAQLGLESGEDVDADFDAKLAWFAAFDEAHALAVKTLNRRPLSAQRLGQRLTARGYDDDVIELVVEAVRNSGHLDEHTYGRSVVHAMTRSGRTVGPHLLRQRLALRGIQSDIIESVIDEWERETETTPGDAIDALITSNLRRMRRLTPETQARRLHGFLIRRGFDPSDVESALRQRFDLLFD